MIEREDGKVIKKTQFVSIVALCLASFTFFHCASTGTVEDGSPESGDAPEVAGTDASVDDEVYGFGILRRLPGQWHGPVMTTTPAGSFDDWYVDFRPVSPGQVSQYSTLDADTINYLSFFVVKHEDRLVVAMRTEGVFQNKGCVTYEKVDEVDEAKGYYRFSDFQTGDDRAYTEFYFKDDWFVMNVFTNRFNTVSPLELHSKWEAKLGTRGSAIEAIDVFAYPQPVMVKDFTDVFRHRSESIYYDLTKDPYDSLSQPYVGNVTVNISIDEDLPVESGNELFLLLTTDSLFDGYDYIEENLKYISKYVFLPASSTSHTFTHVHPGRYYLYSYNDKNNDRRHLSGDYMSSDLNNVVIVPEKGSVSVDSRIDYVIP